MFCPKCGKQIDYSDGFCRYCGHNISSVPPTSSPVTVKNVYSGKDMQILGIVSFLFCGMAGCATLVGGNTATGSLLLLGSVAGLIIYLIGRAKHWYHAE